VDARRHNKKKNKYTIKKKKKKETKKHNTNKKQNGTNKIKKKRQKKKQKQQNKKTKQPPPSPYPPAPPPNEHNKKKKKKTKTKKQTKKQTKTKHKKKTKTKKKNNTQKNKKKKKKQKKTKNKKKKQKKKKNSKKTKRVGTAHGRIRYRDFLRRRAFGCPCSNLPSTNNGSLSGARRDRLGWTITRAGSPIGQATAKPCPEDAVLPRSTSRVAWRSAGGTPSGVEPPDLPPGEGMRTETRAQCKKGKQTQDANIGSQSAQGLANLMISERLKFPRTTTNNGLNVFRRRSIG